MRNWQLFFSLIFLLLIFSTLYFKYYAANLRHTVHKQENYCRELRTYCELLRLEWVFLTSPQNMDDLGHHFPKLYPLKPEQIAGKLP